MLTGKTERRRLNGAFARNVSNKAKRVSWQHDPNATNGNFPRDTCNGKMNRSVIVIKMNGKRAKLLPS